LDGFEEERITMKSSFTVQHNEHASRRPFEEFETTVHSREATSCFMRFLTVDHGAGLTRIRLNTKARILHDRQS
jgi:hypothetical protein